MKTPHPLLVSSFPVSTGVRIYNGEEANVLKKYMNCSGVIVVCHGMIISTLMELGPEPIDYCEVYEYIVNDRELE